MNQGSMKRGQTLLLPILGCKDEVAREPAEKFMKRIIAAHEMYLYQFLNCKRGRPNRADRRRITHARRKSCDVDI